MIFIFERYRVCQAFNFYWQALSEVGAGVSICFELPSTGMKYSIAVCAHSSYRAASLQ
ncbi:hypothetical protein EMIT0194MI4_60046 [Pseudomonas sp. IT-194MI4]